ncbi:uncharacterized protein [Parasteatoda tepidariorum]|uniref:uncharacterized protein n=1 Tax=Parasteatoda tepidariorum TaxID=114398 RepID=UPI0039BC7ACC
MIKDCGSKCQPACREQTYDVKYDEIEFSTRLCDQDDINCRKSDVFLSVSFRKFQLSKHIFEPKYKSIELFSYIGGYMGMWLGISLVSIFDLLESLCYLVYYPFMPKKVFKNRIS